MTNPLHVAFVNSGILGHRSVARLIRDSVGADRTLDPVHLNVADDLSVRERIVRRLICFDRTHGAHGVRDALLLTRWRHELHAGLVAAARIAREEHRTRPFDALHFHTQATAMASVRRMRRTPSVVSIDITQHLASLDADPGMSRLAYAVGALHDRAVFRAAAGIVSPSAWAASDLASQHPECAEKVHVLPYPVPLDLFSPDWLAARHARDLAGEAPVRVLFVGGDFPRKGGFDLLNAWHTGGFASGATLRLVTDWPLSDPLPRGVSQTRGVRAFTDEWIRMWREADLFVMPTRSEAVGMVFQESGAAGVPAIGTTLNTIPEIVEDGRTGLLVPVGDTPALTMAMRTLIQDGGTRRGMAQAARRRAEAAMSVPEYGRRLSALIHRVVGGVGD